jgi:replicative DNA helicase
MTLHADPELEGKVLGAILLEREAFALIADMVKPETFHTERHQHIYGAMGELFLRGDSIDHITVADVLRKKGTLQECGGETYLVGLTMNASGLGSVEAHGRILIEKSMLRTLYTVGAGLVASVNDLTADPFELMDEAERRLMEAAGVLQIKSPRLLDKILPEIITRIDAICSREAKYFGQATGLRPFDNYTGGLESKLLYIVAGRPSQGKSALATSMATYIADSDPVGMFSLEMSEHENLMRLISGESGISYQDLKDGRFSHNDDQARAYDAALSKLRCKKLLIDDTPALGIAELKAKARRLKSEHRIKGMFVDYLQLMKMPKAETRDISVGEVTRALKQMAKELDVWVVCLSQLNRAVEARPDKRPILSDLRESGNIEQDADVVLFVWRPEFYQIDVMPDNTPSKDKAMCSLAKQRNGQTGDFQLNFQKERMRFVSPALPAHENVPAAVPANERYEANDERPF